MRPHKLRPLLLLLLLLSLPLPGYSFDGEAVLQSLVWVLLLALAGLAALVGLLVATGKLLQQLGQPEAIAPAQRRAAGCRIVGLTLPATVVAWALMAWLTYDPSGGWYYPAVPLALLLGLAGGGLLWWRQRPTAAKALLAGMLLAGAAATAVRLSWPLAHRPPVPLGLVGHPAFKETPSAAAPAKAADTSHVYTYVEQMPGFRGTGTALEKLVRTELRYPEQARNDGLSGIVQVAFTVRPDGTLGNIRVTQSLSPACDTEALRVMQLLAPYFSPGSQNGRLVPVQQTLSFGFGANSVAGTIR